MVRPEVFKTSFKDGFLNLEIPKREQNYIYNKMIEYIHDKTGCVSSATTIHQSTEIFRLGRMAFDVAKNSRISNMSYEDLVLLLVFVHSFEDWDNNELVNSLQSNRHSLTKDGDDYPTMANDAAKSVNLILNS